jgi:hypothetical protein
MILDISQQEKIMDDQNGQTATAPPSATPTEKPQTQPPPPPVAPIDWLRDPAFNADLPPRIPTRITMTRMKTYHMPGGCVVCSSTYISMGRMHTSNQITSGRLRTTLSLDFPICEKCKRVQTLFQKNSQLAGWIAFGITVLGFVLFLLIGANMGNKTGDLICPGLIGGFVIWMILFFALSSLFALRYPVPVRERDRRIHHAVKMLSFSAMHVIFLFENATYAQRFEQVNGLPFDNLQNMLQNLTNKPPAK